MYVDRTRTGNDYNGSVGQAHAPFEHDHALMYTPWNVHISIFDY